MDRDRDQVEREMPEGHFGDGRRGSDQLDDLLADRMPHLDRVAHVEDDGALALHQTAQLVGFAT